MLYCTAPHWPGQRVTTRSRTLTTKSQRPSRNKNKRQLLFGRWQVDKHAMMSAARNSACTGPMPMANVGVPQMPVVPPQEPMRLTPLMTTVFGGWAVVASGYAPTEPESPPTSPRTVQFSTSLACEGCASKVLKPPSQQQRTSLGGLTRAGTREAAFSCLCSRALAGYQSDDVPNPDDVSQPHDVSNPDDVSKPDDVPNPDDVSKPDDVAHPDDVSFMYE